MPVKAASTALSDTTRSLTDNSFNSPSHPMYGLSELMFRETNGTIWGANSFSRIDMGDSNEIEAAKDAQRKTAEVSTEDFLSVCQLFGVQTKALGNSRAKV